MQVRNSSGAYLPIKEVWARDQFVVHPDVLAVIALVLGHASDEINDFLRWIALMARILCAFVPGERERRDDYIATAGDRVVASPVRW